MKNYQKIFLDFCSRIFYSEHEEVWGTEEQKEEVSRKKNGQYMNFDDYLKSDQAKEKMKELNSERKDIFKTDSINGINSSNVFNESFDRQLQKVSGKKFDV